MSVPQLTWQSNYSAMKTKHSWSKTTTHHTDDATSLRCATWNIIPHNASLPSETNCGALAPWQKKGLHLVATYHWRCFVNGSIVFASQQMAVLCRNHESVILLSTRLPATRRRCQTWYGNGKKALYMLQICPVFAMVEFCWSQFQVLKNYFDEPHNLTIYHTQPGTFTHTHAIYINTLK